MTEVLVRGLFPEDVAVAWSHLDEPPGELFAEEEAHIVKAVAKRRREFAHGRTCARRALASLGIAARPLLVGAAREPLWPPGVVGSITHDRELCIAVAAPASVYRGIGIDIEPDEPLAPDVAARIWSRAEASSAHARAVVPEASAAKLVFAAKEAVYKCQFPITGEYVGFHDVSIDLAPRDATEAHGDVGAHVDAVTHITAGTFVAVFNEPVAHLPAGFRLTGAWRRANGEIFAAVWSVGP